MIRFLVPLVQYAVLITHGDASHRAEGTKERCDGCVAGFIKWVTGKDQDPKLYQRGYDFDHTFKSMAELGDGSGGMVFRIKRTDDPKKVYACKIILKKGGNSKLTTDQIKKM